MIKTPLSTMIGGAFWTPNTTVIGGGNSGGNSGGNGYDDWTLTNATYADGVVTWDGVGTIAIDGVGAIPGYQIDIPAEEGVIDITIPNIPDAPSIFRVEHLGEVTGGATYDIYITQADTGSRQSEYVVSGVDASEIAYIFISDTNSTITFTVKNSEGVILQTNDFPNIDAQTLPKRISAFFMNPSDAFTTVFS